MQLRRSSLCLRDVIFDSVLAQEEASTSTSPAPSSAASTFLNMKANQPSQARSAGVVGNQQNQNTIKVNIYSQTSEAGTENWKPVHCPTLLCSVYSDSRARGLRSHVKFMRCVLFIFT